MISTAARSFSAFSRSSSSSADAAMPGTGTSAENGTSVDAG
jgi:hypothetical protein